MPRACGATIPEETVAITALLVPHIPPPVALDSVVFMPRHAFRLPVIGVIEFTITVAALKQPVGSVYDIVVKPVPTPVSRPVGLMLATTVEAEDHVPPTGVLPSVTVDPLQIDVIPVIAVGAAFTVTILNDLQPGVKA